MARLARVVVPGLPHHITERGDRRQQTFFREDDYAAYVEPTAEWCVASGRGLGVLPDAESPEEQLRDLREHARTGCPLGNATFLDRLEKAADRVLRPRKASRPPKLLKRP